MVVRYSVLLNLMGFKAMSGVTCPIECLEPSDDFIERNGAWVLTVIGLAVGCVGTLLTYFLKSRCSRIACCGLECVRDVIKLKESQIQIQTPNSTTSNA